jgi:carbonic anhydrase
MRSRSSYVEGRLFAAVQPPRRIVATRQRTQALIAVMSSFPKKLADRYRRFHRRHFLPKAEEYEELATHGQSPEAMVISCSDSRVDPETIFSAMPGEMFVVRNVANLVPPFEVGGGFHGVSSAIEFAVLNLRIKHLIVLGHSGCGGVKAALDQSAAIQTEAQFISRWMSMLDDARLKVLGAHPTSPHHEKLAALEQEGIINSIKNLRTFPFVSDAENRGKLALHGAHFDIATGTLSVLNHSRGEFFPL